MKHELLNTQDNEKRDAFFVKILQKRHFFYTFPCFFANLKLQYIQVAYEKNN